MKESIPSQKPEFEKDSYTASRYRFITEKMLQRFYNETKDKDERKKLVVDAMSPHLDFYTGDRADLENRVQEAIDLTESEEEFVAALADHMDEMMSGIDLKDKEYNQMRRGSYLESNRVTKLNEFLFYETKDNSSGGKTMELHVMPNNDLEPGEIMQSLEEGLTAAARLVAEDENIETIEGSSWIVSRYPNLILSLGFTIPDYDPETHDRHEVSSSSMNMKARVTRDELLSKYT